MMSFIVNICLNQIDDKNLKLRLILASPAVFALMLMYTVAKCPESFRYYLMPGSRKYSPEKAYASLLRLRNTKVGHNTCAHLFWFTPSSPFMTCTIEQDLIQEVTATSSQRLVLDIQGNR